MTWYIGIALVLALIATNYRPVWHIVRHPVTLVHEVGHAVVGLLVGARLSGIKLNADSSGVTTTQHAISGNFFSRFFTTLSGYPAPAFFGAAAVTAAISGYTHAGWLALLVMGGLTLVFSRSLFTVLSAAGFTALAALFVFVFGDAEWSTWALALFGGILAFGCINTLLDLTHLTYRKTDEGTDARSLGQLTGISRWFWVVIMWLLAVAVSVGAFYLIPAVGDLLNGTPAASS